MISAELKLQAMAALNVNAYGLSNVLRSIARQKYVKFDELSDDDLNEHLEKVKQNLDKMDKIRKICEQNNYAGNVNFILSTVSHMHDPRCHTSDDIQNVENYFKVIREAAQKHRYCKRYVAEIPLDSKLLYCNDCVKIAQCYVCGNNLDGRMVLIDDERKFFCNNCHGVNVAKKNQGPGKCSVCGKWNEKRDQNARGKSHCSCSQQFYQKHNGSDGMRQQAKELGLKHGKTNIIRYNKSEQHREVAKIFGCKYGKQNLIRYNMSDEHREVVRRIGLTYGKDNLIRYARSIKGKHFKRIPNGARFHGSFNDAESFMTERFASMSTGRNTSASSNLPVPALNFLTDS